MADMLSPGIYLQEADFSEYVASSSTSIVGCVGEAKRGPVGVPTLVTSQRELINIFGTPTEGEYGIYAALQMLTQVSQLYYVRVVRSATKAIAGKEGVDKVIYRSVTSGTLGNGLKLCQKNNGDGTFNLVVYRKNEVIPEHSEVRYVPVPIEELSVETIHNYFVKDGDEYVEARPETAEKKHSINGVVYYTDSTGATVVDPVVDENVDTYYIKITDPETSGDSYVLATISNGGYEVIQEGVLNPDTTYYSAEEVVVPEEETDSHDPLEEFRNLSVNAGDSNYVVSVLSRSSIYVKAEVLPTGGIAEGEKEFVTSGAIDTGLYAIAGEDGVDRLVFRSKYYDSTLNGAKVTVSEPDDFGYFNVYVTDVDGSTIESWMAVTLDKSDSRHIGQIINTGSQRISVVVSDDESLEFGGNEYTFSGGDDGINGISSADIIGEADGVGIYALDNPELLSIDIMAVPGRTDPEVISAALHVCESRGDTILVADTPFGLSASQVVDWTNGSGAFSDHVAFNTSYGAFYWPWVQVADSYSRKNIWLPPSGHIVAKYAYNDKMAYPWVAPAGVVRGRITGVLGIEHSPTKGERDLLYGNRNIVNPIANFQSEGLVIWGQKTMQRKPTALDRVNVRRLVGYIKRSISNATRGFVFEQNNASTWTEWKSVVNPILTAIKGSGGLYEYKISINPSEDDIENNTMPVYVYIKPTKTAEFIPIIFNIAPYSASFTDIE